MKYSIVIWIAAMGLTLAMLAQVAQAYSQEELDMISACFSSPSTCAAPTSSEPTGPQLPLTLIPGAALSFRGDDTLSPRMSPDGSQIAFNFLSGGAVFRIARAGWMDGAPFGTTVGPSTLTGLGGIDDSAVVAGTRTTGNPWVSSLPGDLSLISIFDYDSGTANDLGSNDQRIVGSVFDADSGPFGDNRLAIWDFNVVTMDWGLTTRNGLGFGFQGGLLAMTPDGLFAVGLSDSAAATGTFDAQAISFDLTTNTTTALPFLAGTPHNDALANALSDDASIIIGNVDGFLGTPVAAQWSGGGITELPRLPGHTESAGLAVAGDGLTAGGSSGTDAVVWDTTTFGVRKLSGYVLGAGLTIPAGCLLTSVTDMDGDGLLLTGNALCSGKQRVYELEMPYPVPEPSLPWGLMAGVGMLALRRNR